MEISGFTFLIGWKVHRFTQKYFPIIKGGGRVGKKALFSVNCTKRILVLLLFPRGFCVLQKCITSAYAFEHVDRSADLVSIFQVDCMHSYQHLMRSSLHVVWDCGSKCISKEALLYLYWQYLLQRCRYIAGSDASSGAKEGNYKSDLM